MSDVLQVGVLGPLQLSIAERTIDLTRARHRALVTLLAARTPNRVHASELTELLWEGSPPPGAAATLQAYVSLVRKTIGPDAVVSRDGGYVLAIEPDALDRNRFTAGIERGRIELDAGHTEKAIIELRAALDLWRGGPFGEFGEATWALAETAQLDELRLGALERVIDAELSVGRHSDAVHELEQLCTDHPYRESFWAQLMLALYRSGRQADALAAYKRVRMLLQEELGIDPTPELADLEVAILRQERSLELRTGPSHVRPRRHRRRSDDSVDSRVSWTKSVEGDGEVATLVRSAPSTFGPGLPQRPAVLRSRVVEVLGERFRARLLVVRAGGGFGKTTALGQALRANMQDPVGHDVWVPCRPVDAVPSQLGRSILRSLRGTVTRDVDAPDRLIALICEDVWMRTPTPVALILDDAHLAAADAAGVSFLASLVDALPANGHLVLSTRTALPLPLARLRAQGDLVELDEDDLRFASREVESLAELRAVEADVLSSYAGWPALTDLAASLGAPVVRDFVWEEVFGQLPSTHQLALARAAAVSSAGAIDADLAAAIGIDLPFDGLFDSLPLSRRESDGSVHLHLLWDEQIGDALDADSRADVQRRASEHLLARGELDAAFRLAAEAGSAEHVTAVVRSVCFANHPTLPIDVLRRWLDHLPPDAATTPEADLLRGVVLRSDMEGDAQNVLSRAVASFRELGDADGEMVALNHLGLVAFWSRDFVTGAVVIQRTIELAATGNERALVSLPVGKAMTFLALGRDFESALAEIEDLDDDAMTDEWASAVEWLRCECLLPLGRPEEGEAAAVRGKRRANAAFWPELEGNRLNALWLQGRCDEALRDYPGLVDAASSSGVDLHALGHLVSATTAFAWMGDLDGARQYHERLEEMRTRRPEDQLVILATEMARATVAILEGRDDDAAVIARQSYESYWKHSDQEVSGRAAVIAYVGVPEWRAAIAATTGHERTQELARYCRVLTEWRENGSTDAASSIEWRSPDQIRAMLPLPWATEVACLATATGDPTGASLVEAIGIVALPWLERLEQTADEPVRAAATALRAVASSTAPIRVNALPEPATIDVAGTTLELGADTVDAVVLRAMVLRQPLVDRSLPFDETADLPARFADAVEDPDQGSTRLAVDLWEVEQLFERADEARDIGDPQAILTIAGDVWPLVVPAFEADASRTPRARATDLDGDVLASTQAWRAALDATKEHALRLAERAAELELAVGRTDSARRWAERTLVWLPESQHAHRVRIGALLAEGATGEAKRAADDCVEALTRAGIDPLPSTASVLEAATS